MKEHKTYGTIEEVVVNEGEGLSNLVVIGFLSASENYPQARILIGSSSIVPKHAQVPGFVLTVAKWRELEALGNAAARDITAACPAHGDPAVDLGNRTRPQALRSYLEGHRRDLMETARVITFDHAARRTIEGEAELVGTFIAWMDEAGIGGE